MPTTAFHGTSPYEPLFGYSRAVRRSNIIHVSGTTSIAPVSSSSNAVEMKVLHPDSAYSQAVTSFTEALRAVTALGGKREDVVRVRVYVRDAGDTGEVGRAMREVMCGDGVAEGGNGGDNGAFAATMIVGVGFVEREMRVEVEVEAVVEE